MQIGFGIVLGIVIVVTHASLCSATAAAAAAAPSAVVVDKSQHYDSLVEWKSEIRSLEEQTDHLIVFQEKQQAVKNGRLLRELKEDGRWLGNNNNAKQAYTELKSALLNEYSMSEEKWTTFEKWAESALDDFLLQFELPKGKTESWNDFQRKYRALLVGMNILFVKSVNENPTTGNLQLEINHFAILDHVERSQFFIGQSRKPISGRRKADSSSSSSQEPFKTSKKSKGGSLMQATLKPFQSKAAAPHHGGAGGVPVFDYRANGWLSTQVANQGTCAACWAFTTATMLEGAAARAGLSNAPISAQQILACTQSKPTCAGGDARIALQFLMTKKKEIYSASDYPYTEVNTKPLSSPKTCSIPKAPKKPAITVDDWKVAATNEDIYSALFNYSPVSVAIAGSSLKFLFYSSGVLVPSDCVITGGLTHEITLIGWKTSADLNSQYWIAKNSWGSDWGSRGYINLLVAGGNQIGTCGYLGSAVYVSKVSLASGASRAPTKTPTKPNQCTSGSLDKTFGTNGYAATTYLGGAASMLANDVVPDGKGGTIVVGAYTVSGDLSTHFMLTRYDSMGKRDNSFGNFVCSPPNLPCETSGFWFPRFVSDHTTPNAKEQANAVAIDSTSSHLYAVGYAKYTTTKLIAIAALDLTSMKPLSTFGFGSGMLGIPVVMEMSIRPNIIDPSPCNGIDCVANAVLVQWVNGKKVVVGGYMQQSNKIFLLARVDGITGSLDTSFGNGGIVVTPVGTGDAEITSMETSSSQFIVGGYSFSSLNMVITLAQYRKVDGSLVSSFGTNGIVQFLVGTMNVRVNSIAIQDDGNIMCVGAATSIVRKKKSALISRFLSNGDPDSNFEIQLNQSSTQGNSIMNPGINFVSLGNIANEATRVIIVENSMIGIIGTFVDDFGIQELAVFGLNFDGSLSSNFNAGAVLKVKVGSTDISIPSIVYDATTSKYYFLGTSQIIQLAGIGGQLALLRYTGQNLDSTFGTKGIAFDSFRVSSEYPNGIRNRADGNILVFGSSTSIFQKTHAIVTMLSLSGNIDTSFADSGVLFLPPSPTFVNDPSPFSWKVGVQDVIDLGADFITVSFSGWGSFALVFTLHRFDKTGKIVSSFGASGAVEVLLEKFDAEPADVNSFIERRSDGTMQIFVTHGAKFTTAVINLVGEVIFLAPSAGSGKVVAAAADATGMLCSLYDGNSYVLNRIVGTNIIDPTFSTITLDEFSALAVQPKDQKILVTGTLQIDGAGAVWEYEGDFSIFLKRYDSTGALDMSFGTQGTVSFTFGGVDDAVQQIVVANNGDIFVSGYKNVGHTLWNVYASVARFKSNGVKGNFGANGVVISQMNQGQPYSLLGYVTLAKDQSVFLCAGGFVGGNGDSRTFDLGGSRLNVAHYSVC